MSKDNLDEVKLDESRMIRLEGFSESFEKNVNTKYFTEESWNYPAKYVTIHIEGFNESFEKENQLLLKR